MSDDARPGDGTDDNTDSGTENGFVIGRAPWLARLGNLRNVVRQEMVTRQLLAHLPGPSLRVLDVGAGQGTQAMRLARLGHTVTAVEPDPSMRAAFEAAAGRLAEEVRGRVSLRPGNFASLAGEPDPEQHDIVLCHGVLMYLPMSRPAVAELGRRTAPGGLVSIVARNGDAMAWRPASRHDWARSLAMLDELDAARMQGRAAIYRNEIGADARSDTIAALTADCAESGLELVTWYGIRVASDNVATDEPVPDAAELATLLEVEERLGRTDPYRALGTLLHVIARRPERPAVH